MSVTDPVQYAEELQLPTTRTDNAVAAVQAAIDDALDASGKAYSVLLNQTGTSAPVETIAKNGLTGTPTYTRAAPGVYTVNLTGQFPVGKTIVLIANYGSTSPASTTAFDIITAYQTNADQLTITTRKVTAGVITMSDAVLQDTNLLVLVYP